MLLFGRNDTKPFSESNINKTFKKEEENSKK
jgi:hypothetical protein